MKNKTQHIMERFPEKSDDLSVLMAENQDFLDLCEDYEVCINALRHWEKSKESVAEDRVNEYRIIARELEEEITQALNSLKRP
jgi:uncharacterized protein YdcH (DUF465 family)